MVQAIRLAEMRTAQHEAGHALAALLLLQGDGLLRVELTDDYNGRTCFRSWKSLAQESPAILVAIAAAGPVAEARAAGKPLTDGRITGEEDLFFAQSALARVGEQERPATFRRGRIMAAVVVERRWPQIERIASRLIERRTLTRGELLEIWEGQ